MRLLYGLFVCLMILTSSAVYADWQQDVDKLLQADSNTDTDKLIEKITKAKPDWQELYSYLQDRTYQPVETTGFILKQTICIDGAQRPYVLYIPESYDCAKPTPMFVYLHGSASRPEIMADPVEYARKNPFTETCSEQGWILLFPMAQWQATWWDNVGMSNVNNLILMVKRQYNIDDDRVYMGGFSDGSSGSFLKAMLDPTNIAAFVALNGHMGVGSEDGGLETYAPNMANTPIYAVTTFSDRLYPSAMMRPTIDMAIEAGADIFYREFEGIHSFDYAETEMPLILDFMNRHVRDPFPPYVMWEASEPEFGHCRWFSIDDITIDPPAKWYRDYNIGMIDSTISIGFMADDSFKGEGVKVGKVLDGDLIANRIGLLDGDIIIGSIDEDIKNLDELSGYKAGLKRGGKVSLKIIRGGEERILSGDVPPPSIHNLFHRASPSAKVMAQYASNRFNIQSSRLGAFSIFIHPAMVRLEDKLLIRVDGDLVYEAKVTPDIGFMLRNFLVNRDRNLIYVAKVSLSL